MLTEEQAEQLKEQLLKQLVNFPEDKREEIEEQVMSMSPQELEEFLKQNNLIPSKDAKQQCIFCMINEGKMPSYKVAEDQENTAVLEINPLSKGHSLVVPKKHLKEDEIPASSFELAKSLSKKIKEIFKPKKVKISSTNIMGHSLVEVLPLYGNEKERKKASEDELKKLQQEFAEKPKEEKKPEKPKEIIKLKRRMP